jgi:hypothetical protein
VSAYGQAEYTSQYVSDPEKDRQNGLAVLIRWIPGEVVAVYGAAVALLADPADSRAAGNTWIAAFVFALVLGLLGARPWTIKGNQQTIAILVASLVFTAIAFVLWSFTIPGSAGYRWDYAADHSQISVLAALAGLLLGGITEPILIWIRSAVHPKQPADPLAPPPAQGDVHE